MVRTMIWILLLTFSTQALAAPSGLVLTWQGQKSAACHHLVEIFLSELRSLASDRAIELELAEAKTPRYSENERPVRRLTLTCAEPDQLELGDATGDRPVRLRYLAKALGFAAPDWLTFQQKHLRPPGEEITLAPVSREPAGAESTLPEPAPSLQANIASAPPLYKRWWFWALVGGAGAAAIYGITRAARSGPSDSINVEIH